MDWSNEKFSVPAWDCRRIIVISVAEKTVVVNPNGGYYSSAWSVITSTGGFLDTTISISALLMRWNETKIALVERKSGAYSSE